MIFSRLGFTLLIHDDGVKKTDEYRTVNIDTSPLRDFNKLQGLHSLGLLNSSRTVNKWLARRDLYFRVADHTRGNYLECVV